MHYKHRTKLLGDNKFGIFIFDTEMEIEELDDALN